MKLNNVSVLKQKLCFEKNVFQFAVSCLMRENLNYTHGTRKIPIVSYYTKYLLNSRELKKSRTHLSTMYLDTCIPCV